MSFKNPKLNNIGIPMSEKDSDRFRNAQRQWKEAVQNRKKQDVKEMAYWLRKSSCTTL